MGPQGAVEVLEGKSISEISDPKLRMEYTLKKEDEYRTRFANPYEAAKYGYLDDVIEPRNTRFRIIRALRTLSTKKDPGPMKKHGNIPL
jgi:acetyl-CoA carboxylase carboxyltransferase component